MSEEYRLRSPSVGLDEWGDYDSDAVVTDLCADFSQHDTQKVKALLDEVFPLAPNVGFKLLLVAAVVAHTHSLVSGLSSLQAAIDWRRDMLTAVGKFCNVVSYPPTNSDLRPDVVAYSSVPQPVQIPPTPTPPPEDELMSEDVGSDSEGTPQVPSAPFPSVPPPTAPPLVLHLVPNPLPRPPTLRLPRGRMAPMGSLQRVPGRKAKGKPGPPWPLPPR